MLYLFLYPLVQMPSSTSSAHCVPIDSSSTTKAPSVHFDPSSTSNVQFVPVNSSSTSSAPSVPFDPSSTSNAQFVPVDPSSTSGAQFVPFDPSSTSNAQSVPVDPSSTNSAQSVHFDPSSISNVQSVPVDPSRTSNAQPVSIDTILAVVFGICVISLLLILSLTFIWLCVIKKKGKVRSQTMKDSPKPIEAVYEDPDAVISDKFQPSFSQGKEVKTADNVAYSTQLQVLQDKGVKTQENLACNVANTVF